MKLLAQLLFMLAAAALWTALEWVRAWLFTGFPWNLLGISQWQNLSLLPLTRYTGVYGLSFIIVAVNIALFLLLSHTLTLTLNRNRNPIPAVFAAWKALPPRERVPWPLLVSLILLVLAYLLPPKLTMPPQDRVIRMAAIQGNIPQIRIFRPEELDLAIEVYVGHTLEVVEDEQPEIVIWPETAIPDSLTASPDLITLMEKVFAKTKTPMIVGTIEYRRSPLNPKQVWTYNSAVLFDSQGQRREHYDKIKIVPFGEFTPFEKLWPEWLRKKLYMGRSLKAGREHTLFEFKGARIGMNICYEDIFPEISRAATRRGANVLMTITNDAWYCETAGSRQHLSHAVLRAVENFRPMLRNGNNSDTCLILPDGRVSGLLRDPQTGSPFFRGCRVYSVPVWNKLPLTFYTRHGDVFAHLTVVAAALAMIWCLYRHFSRRKRLFDKVQTVPEPKAPVTRHAQAAAKPDEPQAK